MPTANIPVPKGALLPCRICCKACMHMRIHARGKSGAAEGTARLLDRP